VELASAAAAGTVNGIATARGTVDFTLRRARRVSPFALSSQISTLSDVAADIDTSAV
jgi:hypothetical protein